MALDPFALVPDDAPYIEASPDLLNPIQLCRKEIGFTLEQLSKATGVNLQAIHLLEQGCYYPILPRILEFFVDRDTIDRQDLESAYSTWQFHTRVSFGSAVGMDRFSDVGDWDGSISPFEVFREEKLKVSRTGTAKGLCIQPAVLFRLVKNESKSIPAILCSALLDSGLSLDLLDELNERTRDFYSFR